MKSFLKGFIITLLIILIIGVGGFFLMNTMDTDSQEDINFRDLLTSKEKYQVLLIGVDSLNSKKAENTRSDVMMILNIDKKNNTFSLVSIPRDTRTEIPDRGIEKINHAYAYGGAELSLQTVNQRLNLSIPYYMVIDYEFVKDLVDIIGGVEVDIPMDMYYEDPTADPPLMIDLKKGKQVLNGDEALQFLRFRKGYADQDLGRIQAQQAFMVGFFNAIKSKEGILRAPQLLVSYVDHVVTNLPMTKVTRMGIDSLAIGTENLNTTTLAGYPDMIDGLSYYVLDDTQVEYQLKELGLK